MPDSASVPVKNPEVIESRIENSLELCLGEAKHHLNDSGEAIWNLIDGKQSTD